MKDARHYTNSLADATLMMHIGCGTDDATSATIEIRLQKMVRQFQTHELWPPDTISSSLKSGLYKHNNPTAICEGYITFRMAKARARSTTPISKQTANRMVWFQQRKKMCLHSGTARQTGKNKRSKYVGNKTFYKQST